MSCTYCGLHWFFFGCRSILLRRFYFDTLDGFVEATNYVFGKMR